MSRNGKILIVDDELHIRELLSQILKEDFNALDFAEDGEEACQKLEKTNYDLVITDLDMPKAGWACCSQNSP